MPSTDRSMALLASARIASVVEADDQRAKARNLSGIQECRCSIHVLRRAEIILGTTPADISVMRSASPIMASDIGEKSKGSLASSPASSGGRVPSPNIDR